jgi:hypothetical protein
MPTLRALFAALSLPLLASSVAAQQPPAGTGTQVPKTPPAQAQPIPPQPALAVPSPETMLALVRTSLIALDHALRTGNFTVMLALGAPFLQANFTPERLAAAFANLRSQRPDLAATTIVTPQLTEAPVIAPNGMLRLAGGFPTRPNEIRFEMMFQAAGGEWRLAGMNVAAVPVAATPPAAAPAASDVPLKKPSEKALPKAK